MDILKRLVDLGQTVNQHYPKINHGGCCVYAALVARALKDRGIESRGIAASCMTKDWYTGKVKDLDPVRKKITNNTCAEWNENDVYFGHVGIEFKYRGRYRHYDSNGLHMRMPALSGLTIYKGRLTLEEMESLAATRDGWNSTFDRKHIPDVKRMVEDYLRNPERD